MHMHVSSTASGRSGHDAREDRRGSLVGGRGPSTDPFHCCREAAPQFRGAVAMEIHHEDAFA